jgi:Flp pilus assembly protein TadG
MIARRFRHARGAVAAVEFALVAPVLLAMMAGLADFGLALSDQSQMASAVAQGAQFAYLNPTTATSQNMVAVVEAAAPFLANSLTTTTVTASSPAFFCVNSGSAPPTPATVSTTCTGDGTKAGSYVTITAKYLYPAILPFYSRLGNTTLTETITARIH